MSSNPKGSKTTMREAFEQAKVAEVTPLAKRIVARMAKQDQRTSSRGRFAKRSAA
jgi:hypothetical protein